ncbi:MAG: hypothetical protein CMN57_12580 [Gammaproteobacteria bacterium]|nr:hypothetical protein [Gammaproteobacteria bacterium]
MQQQERQRLFDLLSIPTAPFREQAIHAHAVERLQQAGVAHFTDPYGNLVVGVDSPVAYRRLLRQHSQEPVRLFIAHMDHPGFHGRRWHDDRTLEIAWHGGSPVRHLRNARVWLADARGYVGTGRLQAVELHEKGYCITRARVRTEGELRRGVSARKLFGGFAFRKPVWRSGARVYTKAADDLVGVHCILETAVRLKRTGERPFLGLLTRAEEVGFVGAVAHFELGWLETRRRPLVCVSLEASRTLPGACIGRGPVVRLGDRRTVFEANAMQLLDELAARTLKDGYQRRIMDGGSCEATAATAFGLPTVGLTVPLGNYHNEGYEGGADCPRMRGPAPEFVNLRDVEGMRRLCQALMRRNLPWQDPWRGVRRRLQRNRKGYGALLKEWN